MNPESPNTPAIPEEVRQSIKDYSAGRSPRATVQADCIFGYSIAQKEISTLEATIQDQDRQILELKDVIQAARLALKEISTGTDFPLSVAQNALQVIFTYLNKK